MCVIAVKPEGIDLPSIEHLKVLFDANKDGAGFMYARSSEVRIRKGFMTLDALKEGLAKERLTKNDVVVYHFRIATSGGIAQETTHPFPVSDSENDLRSLSINTNMGMAHNGILSDFGDKNTSDTMAFVRDILASKVIKENIFSGPMTTLVEMAVGKYNRIIVLRQDKKFQLMGNWIQKGNLYYSNDNWDRTTTYNSNTHQTSFFPSGGNRRLSKRVRRQLRKAGFVETSSGVWVKPTGTTAVASGSEEDRWDDTDVVTLPNGATECPRCKNYVWHDAIYCTKCAVFFDREEETAMIIQ